MPGRDGVRDGDTRTHAECRRRPHSLPNLYAVPNIYAVPYLGRLPDLQARSNVDLRPYADRSSNTDLRPYANPDV